MIKVLRLLKYFLGSGHSLCAWLLANEIARIHCLALGRSRALNPEPYIETVTSSIVICACAQSVKDNVIPETIRVSFRRQEESLRHGGLGDEKGRKKPR